MKGHTSSGKGSPPLSADTVRDLYTDSLRRAMRHVAAHVSHDEALEIAHLVATSVVQRIVEGDESLRSRSTRGGPVVSIDAFIHRAVVNRLADLWRANRSRKAAEELYHGERVALAPAWTQPDSGLESRELHQRIEGAIQAMPESMRRIFLLVRRDHRSYKDAAAELGIGVGTVHTQLSRANALLRQAVADYRAAEQSTNAGASGRAAGAR